jgi:hypothetical protein
MTVEPVTVWLDEAAGRSRSDLGPEGGLLVSNSQDIAVARRYR